ncbi:MAG: hypothetical protein QM754_06615 [Tepidisphaeraceae bacterium]
MLTPAAGMTGRVPLKVRMRLAVQHRQQLAQLGQFGGERLDFGLNSGAGRLAHASDSTELTYLRSNPRRGMVKAIVTATGISLKLRGSTR